MAFGKDPSRVNTMNIRQTLHRGTKRAPKAAGGGKIIPYWKNQFQPTDADGSTDIIRLIGGSYPTPRVDLDAKDYVRDAAGGIIVDPYPYVRYINYQRKINEQFKSCIGSEGPLGDFKGKGDPCLAGDWFWWEWRQRNKNKSKSPHTFSRREMFAITVLVQAPFYKVPQTDRSTGKIRMNPDTKEPFYDWVKGSRRGNSEYAAAGYEKKEGHLMHWSMGFSHWKTLTSYAETLQQHCRSCGSQDSIEELALVCRHCGEAIVEFDTTSLNEEELQKVRADEVRCPHCGKVGYLEEVVQCRNCSNAEQATLFDFDLEVKRVHTGSGDSKQTALSIIRAIGPRPLDSKYGEDLRKPLPLDRIFAPTPIDVQREMFGEVPSDEDVYRAGVNGDDEDSLGSREYRK